MKSKSGILCFSGGVESTTTGYMMKKELGYDDILALSVSYGHRARKEELFCIKKTVEDLGMDFREISLPWLKEISGSFLTDENAKIPKVHDGDLSDRQKAIERMKWWWVPSRNVLIAAIAAAFAEHDLIYHDKKTDIFLGLRREVPVPMPDNTPEFVDQLNRLFEVSILSYHAKDEIEVFAPVITMTKEEIIKRGEKLGVKWEYTYSCYSGNKGKFKNGLPVHCGICSNCKRRKAAFKDAGVADPSIYRV